jgi:hypothetical protein
MDGFHRILSCGRGSDRNWHRVRLNLFYRRRPLRLPFCCCIFRQSSGPNEFRLAVAKVSPMFNTDYCPGASGFVLETVASGCL